MGIFSPSDLAKECDKAGQILKGFIEKGRIPTEALANAKGLAIFRGVRAGMYLAGSGGSGIVTARLPDGTWSPPSAFAVRSGSFGLVYGVDFYDCVCVLNTQEAVEAYTKPEINLGGGLALAAGPVGGTPTTRDRDIKPVWVYTRSRGLYGGLTVDGTIIRAKPDSNAGFYGADVSTEEILKGEVKAQNGAGMWPAGAKSLTEVLQMINGISAQFHVI